MAEDVAEPCAGDEQHRVRDRVAGHELQAGAGGAERGVHRGDRDIDDVGVEYCHDLAGEHDGERHARRRDPAGPARPAHPACLAGVRDGDAFGEFRHATKHGASLMLVPRA